jgi:alpha-galactosidase/6-phospho-beta-glucosidase family protein
MPGWVNFTNPSGIITETLLKHTPLKVVGLCNNPINFTRLIAGLFGVPDEAVFLEWVGLNHVNWIRRVYVGGRDVSADLMARVREGLPFYPFDADLVEALGVFPTWYLQYYYYPDRKVEEMRQAGKTRGEVVMEVEQELLRKYADPNRVVKPPELSQRGRRALLRGGGAPYPLAGAGPAGRADCGRPQRRGHPRPPRRRGWWRSPASWGRTASPRCGWGRSRRPSGPSARR